MPLPGKCHLFPRSSRGRGKGSVSLPAGGPVAGCHIRGVAVMYSRRSEGMRELSWSIAHDFLIRPDAGYASSTTTTTTTTTRT